MFADPARLPALAARAAPRLPAGQGVGVSAILGVGLDLVELARIARLYERHGEAFAERFCLPGERQERRGETLVQHLGGLFAAKEAVLKALGTGWAQRRRAAPGRDPAPGRRRAGGAAAREAERRAGELGVRTVHVSITHDRGMAAAVAVLEGESPPA